MSSTSSKIRILNHPLVLHKLSLLRDKRIKSAQFRSLLNELSLLLAMRASQSLLESPIAPYQGVKLRDEIALFPIMRAGDGLVDGMLTMVPSARVHHLGLYREKSTLLPVEYYNKLPAECTVDVGFVLDPMVATSGTAVAAVNILKDWGLKRIKFCAVIASRAGIEALTAAHPDIDIYVCAIDDVLDERGYIIPGLGDAGDRLFKTAH
ncbi:uracil phosphoribosyltransferase-domain-containing protein [Blyttiomyces helicus]|uniref:uracil phosphoribosyltransferase n=1 Tax=Blyttiomyces helicus TaxID=388810 RepID=A0A4P9WA48_9FUNG|nr:uracil phosphoribosyltransferase-domain-containing protein [Blyttiomyces helicus]|eukprot:RKO88405.1 uracil phosphoribosyltransferase-domain-containing protein [Blyttiomyces helicus]